MYRLIFQQRETSRAPYTGDPGSLSIGRDPGCGLRLTEPGVRDQHAAIDRRETGYFLRDLTNSNSIHVNGEAITERRLATGDELEIGAVRLKFEVVQEPPPERRSFDPWQLLAGIVIIGFVVGQVGLFLWIFIQPHPRNMRTDIVTRGQAKLEEMATVSPAALVPLIPTVVTPPAAPPTTPEILSRQVRVVHDDRHDSPDGVAINLQIRAQVGERELDASAIAISVQFFVKPAKLAATQWLAIPPGWQNFSSKVFAMHFAGPPGQFAGYVVRSYYHKQLQDVTATDAALETAAPAAPLP